MSSNPALERIQQFVSNHPDAGVMDVLGQLCLPPEYDEVVAALIDGDEVDQSAVPDPVGSGETSRNSESSTAENVSERKNRKSGTQGGDGAGDDGEGTSGTSEANKKFNPGKTDPSNVPTSESGATTSKVRSALEDAIEFFQAQLDRDISDAAPDDIETPRDYFTEKRGWETETIESKRLGYAPANPTALLDHLMNKGYDRETILGTGLFYEGLTPHFQGRYVFPYLDAEGRPVYAISRALDDHGHPRDPKSGQKYTKAVKSKDYSRVEEPIFGLDSIREGEPILITEGIADAITAHEAGYPCISPVTTRFKHNDRERLLAKLRDRDVPRVFVVQDSERPTTDFQEEADGWGALNVEQFGPGVTGAAATAGYLADNAIGARIAELPRLGLDKVDLDDYLTGWSETLTPVLASAVRPEDHPAYNPRKAAINAATREQKAAKRRSGSTGSALFDLDLADVTPVSDGYRGTNPLGHHGDSENYYVGLDNGRLGYDHKYKVAYNALTHLLCDTGERPANDPNGSLSDGEIFAAWQHAKQEGHVADNDPIPHTALQHVALTHGHCKAEDIEDGWRLPTEAYNAALETVEDKFGLDPGRRQTTGDPMAVLPPLSPKARVREWNWRRAAAQLMDTDNDTSLTQGDVWNRTHDTIVDALTAIHPQLLWALPGTGKTTNLPPAIAETGILATILTQRGNVEKYEEIKTLCENEGLRPKILPSFPDTCLCANGAFGDELARIYMTLYEGGVPPSDIHAYADQHGIPTPCQHQGRCPYSQAWSAIDPDEYDVLIGHPTHAYVSSVVNGRVVCIDEFVGDAYTTKLGDRDTRSETFDADLQDAVNVVLERRDGLPFESYSDLLANRANPQRRADALAWFDSCTDLTERATDDVFEAHDRGHAAGIQAVYVILAGTGDDGARVTTLDNGWERVEIGEHDNDDTSVIGLFDPATEQVAIHAPPSFEYTRNVVALDGTPTPELWNLALGGSLDMRQVLSDEERREYLTETLNHSYVRTTDYVKTYNNPQHVNVAEDDALLRGIANAHGDPGLITSNTALNVYSGVLNGADNAQDPNPEEIDPREHVTATKYRGNFIGSNDFAHQQVGAVIGSTHYGDDYIKRWAALGGESVDSPDRSNPENRGVNLSYGEVGDRILRHMREHDTAQAILRFGRAPDCPGALVFVHTNTIPDWMECAVVAEPGDGLDSMVVDTYSKGTRQVLRAAQTFAADGADAWRTADLVAHPAVDCTEGHVRRILRDLADRGVLNREREGRGVTWSPSDTDDLDATGTTDATLDTFTVSGDGGDDGADEVANISRTIYYTWNVRKTPPTPPARLRGEAKSIATDGGPRVLPSYGGEHDGPPPGTSL